MTTPNPSPAWCLCRRCEKKIVLWVIALLPALIGLPSMRLDSQRGDIVTAVNGLALSDASNTVKLYQLMKDATDATFDIERDGGTVTVSVDLASP